MILMRGGSIDLHRPSNCNAGKCDEVPAKRLAYNLHRLETAPRSLPKDRSESVAMLAAFEDAAQRLGSVPRALPKVRSGGMATGRSVCLGLGSVPRALPKVRSGCALDNTNESSS